MSTVCSDLDGCLVDSRAAHRGVADLLVRLARLRLLVVTSKPVGFARPILRSVGLLDHFAAVVGPALTAVDEAKTTTLERALTDNALRRQSQRRSTVMIGDREFDVLAGRACGTRTISVTWGAGDRAELEAAGADAVVDRPETIEACILGSRVPTAPR